MKRNLTALMVPLTMSMSLMMSCNSGGTSGDYTASTTPEVVEETVCTGPLVLVEDATTDYVIVRGEDAFISEVTASTELQKYLKQITGVEIPIVTDTTEPAAHEIIVGKTNRETEGEFNRDELGQDGFVIKTVGHRLYLVGGEQRGSLYAVYEFLEAYMGCRFYTAEVEKIPDIKTISLDPIAEDKQIPVFAYRELDWTCYKNGYLCAKRKINGDFAHGNKQPYDRIYEELGGPYFTPADDGHNLSRIIPESEFNEHPEYFALDSSGKRTTSQLCFSNPDVFRITLEYLRELKTRYPYSTFLPISQNDRGGHCQCESCRKISEEEGGVSSGPMLRFINKVAETLKDEMPDTYFWTFAYQGTRNAPIQTTPADNVIIWLCSIECCFSHPFSECSTKDKINGKSFAEDLKDWAAITDTLYIWNYSTNFSHWVMTNPNFDVLLDDMRLFAESGVDGVFDQSRWGLTGAEFEELRCYLLSKIMWDPYMTKEEYYSHMDDFLEGYYGAGWKSIRAYIDLAEELSEAKCWGIYADPEDVFQWPGMTKEVHDYNDYPEELTADMIRSYKTVNWRQYWNWYSDYDGVPQILTEGERLFAEALTAAETDQQKTAVNKSEQQIGFLRSYYNGKKLALGDSVNNPAHKMVSNYFRENPDAFTQDEQKKILDAIGTYAKDAVYAEYADENRAFAERLMSHGVYSIREGVTGWNATLVGVDFTKLPSEWTS